MDYIAHIREKDGEIQTVREHLEAVCELCEKYGEKIGVRYLAGMAGMLHDLGKNTEKFKQYIQDAVNNPDNPPPRGSVDHSTAGGKLIYQSFHSGSHTPLEKLTAEWIAMSIISHHGGLRDFFSPDLNSEFLQRVSKKEIPEFEVAVSSFFETQISEKGFKEYFTHATSEAMEIVNRFKEKKLNYILISLVIKYIFSCLIDADRTNTRMFEEDEVVAHTLDYETFFRECYSSLMKKIESFNKAEDADHPINVLRSEMSQQCEEFAATPSGIYTLSIPTGGGKTLASLRYALKHALTFKKERIVYIVPYTTIIEQNAQEVRDILGREDFILEHHSNVIEDWAYEDEDYDLIENKLQLAKDNWDCPIIFTTMVQFLNTFYAKGTRNIRRLHNLANSVLIFDEVQSIPVKCVSLFNEALNFLSIFGKSSIVLCTATQPALDFVENDLKITANGEIVKDLKKVSESFKRVKVIDRTTPQGMKAVELKDFIVGEMQKVNNLLVILNTKAAVRKLFDQLNDSGEKERHNYTLYHLSTNMCPAHRKKILKAIKKAIEDGKRVVGISTQLIEAGVDISFECVVRSLAGLDSIAQAAGRCNRHGEAEARNVYIIKSADESLSNLKEISIGAEKTKRILEDFNKEPEMFGNDLLSADAMRCYFKYYFDHIQLELKYPIKELKNNNMFDLLDINHYYTTVYNNTFGSHFPLLNKQSFSTAAKYFHVIDQPTTAVLVPYNDEAREIIADLNGDLDIKGLSKLLKRAQQYVINVYKQELDCLDGENNLDLLLHGNVYALKEIAYSDEFGLDLKGEGSWGFTHA